MIQTSTAPLAILFALAAAAPSAAAQAPLTLDATYTFGRLVGEVGDVCAPVDTFTGVALYGEIDFDPGGTFSLTGDESAVCSGGGTSTGSAADGGIYTLSYDGELTLDFDPSMPGNDLFPLRMTWDREVFVGAELFDGEPGWMVGIRQGNGLDESTLSGDYAAASMVVEHAGSGLLQAEGVFADLGFDGAGNLSLSADFRILSPDGGSSGVDVYSETYQVLSNGKVIRNGTGVPVGAVSSDGRIGFLMDRPTVSFRELTVFVRKGGVPTADAVDEDWWRVVLGAEQDTPTSEIAMFQNAGVLDANAGSGSYSFSGGESFASSGGTGGGPDSATGTFALNADGSLQLFEAGPVTVEGWLAESEELAVLAIVSETDHFVVGFMVRQWGPLDGDVDTISLAAGGSQTLELRATAAHAGSPYLVLGSVTGTQPGLVVDGQTIPLIVDSYFLFTLQNPGSSLLPGSFGILDGSGEASASLGLPPGSDPSLAGLSAYHAAAVIDVSGPAPVVALGTNAVPITLTP